MESSFWNDFVMTIGVFGALGLGIDFYIGRNNQQRVRDWLEMWWIKLSDVRDGAILDARKLFLQSE